MSEEAPPEEEDPLAAVASAQELLVSDEDSKREEGAASVEKLASDPRCARFLSAHRPTLNWNATFASTSRDPDPLTP